MRARVYLIPRSSLIALFRGEKRISNLPADAELVAADYGVQGFGVRIHSASFEDIPTGGKLPVVPAVIAHSERSA